MKNHHKRRGLKQHPLAISRLCGPEVQLGSPGFSAQGLTFKVLGRWCSRLKAPSENPLLSSVTCWFTQHLGTDVFPSLLAVTRFVICCVCHGIPSISSHHWRTPCMLNLVLLSPERVHIFLSDMPEARPSKESLPFLNSILLYNRS